MAPLQNPFHFILNRRRLKRPNEFYYDTAVPGESECSENLYILCSIGQLSSLSTHHIGSELQHLRDLKTKNKPRNA